MILPNLALANCALTQLPPDRPRFAAPHGRHCLGWRGFGQRCTRGVCPRGMSGNQMAGLKRFAQKGSMPGRLMVQGRPQSTGGPALMANCSCPGQRECFGVYVVQPGGDLGRGFCQIVWAMDAGSLAPSLLGTQSAWRLVSLVSILIKIWETRWLA
jgi:hypothetical protein